MLGKSKKIINLVIEDYVIRILENAGQNISPTLLQEKPLPIGLIVDGKITDEIGFYEYMKELVKELGIKNRQVRFYVPNSLVIMREVTFPADIIEKDIRDYFDMEIGKSIHLPFKKPVFDVHYDQELEERHGIQEEERKGTLFAASKEEIVKYTEIFADVSLKPIAADVEALGIYRFFERMSNITKDHVYLFVQLNATSLNLSIFNNRKLEFMRYQRLDLKLKGWKENNKRDEIHWEYEEEESLLMGIVEDQIIELERIMNFYRFSIKKGENMVNELVILGDHPLLNEFYQKVNNQLDIPSSTLKADVSGLMDKAIASQFIPALGLALKGGAADAS